MQVKAQVLEELRQLARPYESHRSNPASRAALRDRIDLLDFGLGPTAPMVFAAGQRVKLWQAKAAPARGRSARLRWPGRERPL